MAIRDRKVHKNRGQRTGGWGGAQKHRGAGHRGGRGMAGTSNHKWCGISKFMPDYFLSIGFKRPRCIVKQVNTLNLGVLDEEIKNLCEMGIANEENGRFSINLTELGYNKLLGSGKVTNSIAVTIDSYSKSAKQKIEDAGGEIVVASEEFDAATAEEFTGEGELNEGSGKFE